MKIRKKYLIIGGAGFIGINFAKYLLDEENDVIIFDSLKREGTIDNIDWLKSHNPNFKLCVGDIRFDTKSLNECISQSDVVFHLAAQVAVTTSIDDPIYDFDVNARGMLNILEGIRVNDNHCPIIYASTNKVYGKLENFPVELKSDRWIYSDHPGGVSENEALDLYSPYGCSKGIAELYLKDYSRIYGVRGSVIRQSCIYGPHQMGIEDQGWIAWFLIAATTGTPITIFGDGCQVRDILHVKDLFDLWQNSEKCLSNDNPFSVFNAGGGPENTLSLNELVTKIPSLTGANSLDVSFEAERSGDQKVFITDITKAKNVLDWQPRISKDDGLKELANWVKDNIEVFTNEK